jgi:hypothetical protein
MDREARFKELCNKYSAGLCWLRRREAAGIDTAKDRQAFKVRVIKPMRYVWHTFSPEEKAQWRKTLMALSVFGGRIL